MTEVKAVGGRKTQFHDDLRNRRRYMKIKEEVKDRNKWKRQFINHILRKKCTLNDTIKGQMTEVKVLGRIDDLRNRRRYMEIKEKAENRNGWKRQFINRT